MICKPGDNLPVIALLLQLIGAAGVPRGPELPGGPALISGNGSGLTQMGSAGTGQGGGTHGLHLCQGGGEKGIWPGPV